MTNTAHTTLPWEAHNLSIMASPNKHDQDTMLSVAECTLEDRSPSIAKANAEFIVRACNSHYDLVKALETMLGKAYKQNWNDGYPEILEIAENALAKAKGE